jgi:hypothetical protein
VTIEGKSLLTTFCPTFDDNKSSFKSNENIGKSNSFTDKYLLSAHRPPLAFETI